MKPKWKNPNHKVHLANFVKKYPTVKGRVPQTIILVDPNDWSVALEHPTLNTTVCCQVCSIAERIARTRGEQELQIQDNRAPASGKFRY